VLPTDDLELGVGLDHTSRGARTSLLRVRHIDEELIRSAWLGTVNRVSKRRG
jgi:hypothetical protein